MDPQPNNPPAGSRARVLEWHRRATARIVAGVGAGIAGLISLGMASYALSRPDPIAELAAGQDVDSGRWRINIIEASFARANPDATFYLERRDALRVEMKLTNLSEETSNSYPRLAKLDPAPEGAGEPTFKLARDGSIAGGLHPDMPEHVTAYWAWPEGTAPPTELRFTIQGEFYKPRDNLLGAPGWFPSQPVARVTVPVKAGEGGQ